MKKSPDLNHSTVRGLIFYPKELANSNRQLIEEGKDPIDIGGRVGIQVGGLLLKRTVAIVSIPVCKVIKEKTKFNIGLA